MRHTNNNNNNNEYMRALCRLDYGIEPKGAEVKAV